MAGGALHIRRYRPEGEEAVWRLHNDALDDTAVRQEAARLLYEKNGYREMRRRRIGAFECVFYEKSNLA